VTIAATPDTSEGASGDQTADEVRDAGRFAGGEVPRTAVDERAPSAGRPRAVRVASVRSARDASTSVVALKTAATVLSSSRVTRTSLDSPSPWCK